MILCNKLISGRFREGFGRLARTPFDTKLFYFHGDFSEKSGNNNKYSGKIKKSKPPRKFEPLSRNPGSALDLTKSNTYGLKNKFHNYIM